MNKREETICLRIYEENRVRVHWYLRNNYSWLNEEDISDVMQEVWRALTENIEKVCEWDSVSQFKWLLTVTRNQAITMFRKNERRAEAIERYKLYEMQQKTSPSAENVLSLRRSATAVLQKLSAADKDILFGDLLHKDQPEKPKDNAYACKSYRARKKLEKHMEEGGL